MVLGKCPLFWYRPLSRVGAGRYRPLSESREPARPADLTDRLSRSGTKRFKSASTNCQHTPPREREVIAALTEISSSGSVAAPLAPITLSELLLCFVRRIVAPKPIPYDCTYFVTCHDSIFVSSDDSTRLTRRRLDSLLRIVRNDQLNHVRATARQKVLGCWRLGLSLISVKAAIYLSYPQLKV